MKHYYSSTRITFVLTVVFIMATMVVGLLLSNHTNKRIEEERRQRNSNKAEQYTNNINK